MKVTYRLGMTAAAVIMLLGGATAEDQPLPTIHFLAELPWVPMDPSDPEGAKSVTVWGDPARGAYGSYQSFPAGSSSPLHSFSHEQRIVMLQGTTLHWLEGETQASAVPKKAGAAMVMPAGVKHYAACAQGEDCIVFVTQDGPADFILEEGH